jgi:peroxiredoxin
MPQGYFGWLEREAPEKLTLEEPRALRVGDWFPSCRLILLNTIHDRDYLRITHDSRGFSLEDVEIDYLLIEFYNELCSECLEEVRIFKSLFKLLEEDPEWGPQIRVIGIGAGSKKRSVARFRKAHAIPFPLFADERWELFKCLGDPLLPVSYLVKREGSKRRILMIQSGHIGSGKKLLKKILSSMQAEGPALETERKE